MPTPPASSETPPAIPRVHVVDDLECLKVLADPLRLRILEALCAEARTTKQVAEVLHEPPTRLYHHVDTLERAGLVQLERTRPVRGTLEKYYRAVARTFRADPRLFELDAGATGAAVATRTVVAELLESAAAQLRATPSAPSTDETAGASRDSNEEREWLAVSVSLRRLGRERLAEARRRLEALLEEMQGWASSDAARSDAARSDAPEPSDTPEHRLVVALYPLETEPRQTQETSS